ncbi:MAG: S8 family peptidase [Rhodoglobus sp.]
MANEPVQVVLNPGKIREPREKNPPVDNGTDFFEGRNEAFGTHREEIAASLEAVLEFLEHPTYRAQFGGLGQLQVVMAPRSIAKSHRPQSKLFRSAWTPHVGTASVGQPIYAVTPSSLRAVIAVVRATEIVVEQKLVARTGEMVANPSRARCEVGGIERISLWSEPDKRHFSAVEASAWLSRAATGGKYFIELFPEITAPRDPTLAIAERESLRSLRTDLVALGVEAQSVSSERSSGIRAITLRVQTPDTPALVAIASHGEDQADAPLAIDQTRITSLDPAAHERILNRVAQNPMIRSIALPPIVSIQDEEPFELESAAPVAIFTRQDGLTYPRVGVIDGGVAGPVSGWVEEIWGQLAAEDKDASHGTFISGLLVAAGTLNTYLRDQAAGCLLYDLDVLPTDPTGAGIEFASYYPDGVIGFMDEIESAVEHFRQTRGVRVYNFSINITSPGNASRYGFVARRLDEIASRLDVLFVISAGNLDLVDFRREWATDPLIALADLTSDRLGFLSEPGESLFNASVSALNPPGLQYQVPFALARYSRRGPGLLGAVKPDFAHIGGSGSPSVDRGSGLFSLDVGGRIVAAAGTSYATPLVARRLADLDNFIEGDVSREMLLALMVHHAWHPEIMKHRVVLPASRNLIGFGVPGTVEEMLQSGDSEITLVFNSVIKPRQQAKLDFAWPPSLVREGKCRGYARLTLVVRPVLAYEHGDERIRVNVDAKLMQEQKAGGYENRLKAVTGRAVSRSNHPSEQELLKEAMKWQVVKTFRVEMTGKGPSSNWRFLVEYLTRADESLPPLGVEFCAILTIGDRKREAPVFQEMRQILLQQGIKTADIQTAIRVRAQA